MRFDKDAVSDGLERPNLQTNSGKSQTTSGEKIRWSSGEPGEHEQLSAGTAGRGCDVNGLGVACVRGHPRSVGEVREEK